MTDCLFCKIVNKEISACIVFENESVLAFLDINPKTKGHTILIPKKHSKNILDIEEIDWKSLSEIMPKLAKAVTSASEAEGFNLKVNNGSVAGQEIPHTHVHFIPRKQADGYVAQGHGSYENEDEKNAYADRIRVSIDKM